MDTKWKNTVEDVYNIYSKIHMPGLFMTVMGMIGFGIMMVYRHFYSTLKIYSFGIMCNLCIGIGISLLLKQYLSSRYQNWSSEEGHDYEKWGTAKRESLKRMYQAGGAWFLAAAGYMCFLIEINGTFWNHDEGYGTGYIMIITILVQLLICQNVIETFWHKELDSVMEYAAKNMEKIQQIRLQEALEIEKKSLEKVSRSDQLRVDLITNVSHDLKTPLTSIVGYIELIKKEELSDVVQDYVDVISSRTEKLGEMINSLFSLAKASSGNVELHKEKFEVNRLIEQIFADMDDRIEESGLKFVPLLTEENTEIYSDNMYFYRICQNLIENALKYSAKGTRVFVKTYLKNISGENVLEGNVLEGNVLEENVSGENVLGDNQPVSEPVKNIRIEVTNTAGYLMDFTKEDIVERFVRGDQARTSEGNGLGLAIVSSYTKALGGEFDIKIDCDQFKACLEFSRPDQI